MCCDVAGLGGILVDRLGVHRDSYLVPTVVWSNFDYLHFGGRILLWCDLLRIFAPRVAMPSSHTTSMLPTSNNHHTSPQETACAPHQRQPPHAPQMMDIDKHWQSWVVPQAKEEM